MHKLHTIHKNPKSTKRRKVVGRGLGSGHGTYSTRGGKGQTARTGHSKMPARFEGGRQPLIRQLPKLRGFKSLAVKPIIIKLDKLSVFEDGDIVTLETLKNKGLLREADIVGLKVKIVGGKISKKLTLKVPATKSVIKAIVEAGGKA